MKIDTATFSFISNTLTMRLESEADMLEAYSRVKNDPEYVPATVPTPNVTIDDIERIIRLLYKHGHKIEAIKLYRTVTLAGLRDAKEACDRMVAGAITF